MITRFAPSPTGPLHLGHAFSAMLAHDMAMAQNGTFLLRIEDIDQSRARPEWEKQIYNDLRWLGLRWPDPVMRQSDRLPAYAAALDALWERNLLYPCTCSRRDIQNAVSAPQEGVPSHGPDGLIYPGTCRGNRSVHANRVNRPMDQALRLDMAQAVLERDHRGGTDCQSYMTYRETMTSASVHDTTFSRNDLCTTVGDVVLSRPDMQTSYHLSVVLDDAAQGITDVVRGNDLLEATKIHVLLQNLLDLPTPTYHHHGLIRDDAGKRLAKRDDARAISKFRADGATPADIRRLVGLPLHLGS